MRRLLTLLTITLLPFIAGCSSEPRTDDKATTPAEAPASTDAVDAEEAADAADEAPTDDVVAAAMVPSTGDIKEMQAKRRIRMLVTFSRTNYFLDRARQMGATYEAGRAFEDFVNKELNTRNLRIHVLFIPVRRDEMGSALTSGRGDIAAANLTITDARRAAADFSVPLLKNVSEVVVTTRGAAPLTTVEDLSGRDVFVRRTSSYFESLTKLNEALAARGKAPVRIIEADSQLEDEDILEMVNGGLVKATVVDDHVAKLWQQIYDQLDVHPDVTVRTGGEIGWAVRKGAPKLRALVDKFVTKHGEGTTFGNVVIKRYFGNTGYLKNSTSPEEQRKFRTLIKFFRQYGDQYDLPYLLLAAQGYQESQLDQNRRSSVGAVGVMQIKPSTAEGSPVFIKGVDKDAQKNIQAGAKYLRWIADEYFKDEPMTKIDKGLFALASYNAGAGRVSGLRRKAKNMGLDENKWFQNVEIVAAREIGRETVQYVGNIYKYYVAYDLLVRQGFVSGDGQPKQKAGAKSAHR